MAFLSVQDIRIAGIAACVPEKEISNLTCELLDEKERRLFIKNTGIEKRRIAPNGLCASDLCERAAISLIDALSWQKEEIQVLVFVTQTPDYITPATAILLQAKLGLPESCLAFDINLGCSGYVYGLAVVASLLHSLQKGKGLLLVGDISSACVSPLDKSTAPLFSDAGSATALEIHPGDNLFFNLESDGNGYQAIIIPEGGYRHPVSPDSLLMKEYEKGIVRNKLHLILNGIDIFNFSVTRVPENIRAMMQHLNKSASDIDYLILHQANKMINDAIRETVGFPEDKTPLSLREYGNTSSASIPLTMVTQLRDKLQSENLHLILSGFGVGLSWASAYVNTKNICCPELITTA